MSDDNEREKMTTEIQVQPRTALDIIGHAASDPNVDAGKLRELLAIKRDWEADESRKAFAEALSEFQGRAPIVGKGDNAHGKMYAAMDRIWREIRGLMEECGLTVSWHTTRVDADAEMIHLEGTLQHRSGHSQPLSYDLALPNLITGQNKAQQIGSATTYAKRYCICGALGVVTGDDDDGHSVHPLRAVACVTDEQAATLREWIDETGTNVKAFCDWANCDAVGSVPAAKFDAAIKMLKRKAGQK